MTTSSSADTVTLVVDLPRDEAIRRMASANLHAGVNNESNRRRSQFLGVLFVGLGVLVTVLVPPLGLPVAIAGVLVLTLGSRRRIIDRFAKIYEISRFSGEPYTVEVAPQSLNITTPSYAAQWRWDRLTEVREHDGGLVLVWDGALQLLDIPPSAFTDHHHRVDVATLIRTRIQEANTPGPTP